MPSTSIDAARIGAQVARQIRAADYNSPDTVTVPDTPAELTSAPPVAEPASPVTSAAVRSWITGQLAAGTELTGRTVGARYGRDDRWGRRQINAVKASMQATPPAPEPVTEPAALVADPEPHPAVPDAPDTPPAEPDITPDSADTAPAPGTDRAAWKHAVLITLGILVGVFATTGMLAVIASAFALSFDAIAAVAVAANTRPALAWMLPVSVDGAMIVATVAAVTMQKLDGKIPVYPWAVVILGVLVSIAANAAHAMGSPGAALILEPVARALVGAVPAVMLAVVFHLVVELVRSVVRHVSGD